MSDAELVRVVLAYPADASRLVDVVEAVDPRVRAIPCYYADGFDLRARREQHPFSEAVRALVPPLTEEQRAAFATADIVYSLDVPLDLPEVAPKLKWVQNIGSGVGQYVSARLTEGGILLTNTAGLGATPIAEFVLARVLEHYKRLRQLDEIQRTRNWTSTPAKGLNGKVMTVVGLGAIGGEVARRARAFEMRVLGIRRSWKPGNTDDRVDELYGPDDLHRALGQSDVVVLSATGGARNTDLFDAAAFAAMPPGSFFVNIARGSLVDEAALYDALLSGHLGGAAIDVTRVEPLPPDDKLWGAPNLAISAHCATSSDRYGNQVAELFCDNLRRFLDGKPLRNVVDLTVEYETPAV